MSYLYSAAATSGDHLDQWSGLEFLVRPSRGIIGKSCIEHVRNNHIFTRNVRYVFTPEGPAFWFGGDSSRSIILYQGVRENPWLSEYYNPQSVIDIGPRVVANRTFSVGFTTGPVIWRESSTFQLLSADAQAQTNPGWAITVNSVGELAFWFGGGDPNVRKVQGPILLPSTKYTLTVVFTQNLAAAASFLDATFYLNGRSCGTVALASTEPVHYTAPFMIGGGFTGDGWRNTAIIDNSSVSLPPQQQTLEGCIHDVRYYNRALAPQEIWSIHYQPWLVDRRTPPVRTAISVFATGLTGSFTASSATGNGTLQSFPPKYNIIAPLVASKAYSEASATHNPPIFTLSSDVTTRRPSSKTTAVLDLSGIIMLKGAVTASRAQSSVDLYIQMFYLSGDVEVGSRPTSRGMLFVNKPKPAPALTSIAPAGHIIYRDDYDIIYEVIWRVIEEYSPGTPLIFKDQLLDFTTIVRSPRPQIGEVGGAIIDNNVFRHGTCSTLRQVFRTTLDGYDIIAEGGTQVVCEVQTSFNCQTPPGDPFKYHVDNAIADDYQPAMVCGPRFADVNDDVRFGIVNSDGSVTPAGGQAFEFVNVWGGRDEVLSDCAN